MNTSKKPQFECAVCLCRLGLPRGFIGRRTGLCGTIITRASAHVGDVQVRSAQCEFCGETFRFGMHSNSVCSDGCRDALKLMRRQRIQFGSREHRIKARDWRIKQHHKLVNCNDFPKKQCIPCLAKLGMGCKRIGRTLRMAHFNVAGWMKRYGLSGGTQERRKIAANLSRLEPLNPETLIMEGYANEARALVKYDEQRHWWNCQTATNWMTNKSIMLRYRSDAAFRKAHNKKTLRRRQANPVRTAALHRAWVVKREKVDPSYKIKNRISTRLSALLGGRGGSWSKIEYYLGCTTPQLRQHLQAQFQRHMDWNNYGKVWHVDHIVPLSRFDHNKDEQIKTCWNWQNLRPMWARANMRKSNRLTEPQMHLALCMR